MSNLEEKVGYRLLKVLYYGMLGLTVLALLGGIIGCLYYRDGETLAIFISIVIFYGILELIQLGLFYVLFGKLENYKYNLFYKIYNKFGKEKIIVFFKFIFFLIFVGGAITGINIGFNKYQEYQVKSEKQAILKKYGLKNEEEYKFLNRVGEVDFKEQLELERCKYKDLNRGDFYISEDSSEFSTRFLSNNLECYELLEVDTHGGNGVSYAYLYNINKGILVGKTHNKVSDNFLIGGDENVYLNRVDNLMPFNIYGEHFLSGEIKINKHEKSKYQDTLEKVLKLREKQNYKELKKTYKELEQQKIQETFIYMHYRGFSASGNYVGGKWVMSINLRDQYGNYYKPKFSYQTFLSWYKDLSSSSAEKLEKIGDLKYKIEVLFYNSDGTKDKYETTLELIKIGDSYKIKNYKSKKIK